MTLGTLAALGLSRAHMPQRMLIMSLLISPMIVPIIISAAAMFFFYSDIGLAQTKPGIILAHTALGTPFVVITVTATLIGFDHSLIRASANLGATPVAIFFRVIVPLILPGVISGALFAFVTSFDEVVVVIFLAGFDERTIPRQMWAGIREQISPTILAVATMLIIFSVCLMFVLELLRQRCATNTERWCSTGDESLASRNRAAGPDSKLRRAAGVKSPGGERRRKGILEVSSVGWEDERK